jgi:alkanesulfonate monooxygenase SsuD/methylene tetrahydromethanopterin reductase-like flavin-dependent oxidoreductase (luciferase family)
MTLQFGLVLPPGPPKGAIDRYLTDLDRQMPRIESLFSGLWMTDHLFWDQEPTYEAWTILSFIAAKYQFEFGPIVLSQSYRNPALLAKMAVTLQNLSGGRLIMAVGAGWKEDEYHAYDYPFPPLATRLQQLRDTLEILRRMWTEPGKVSYQGKYYSVQDAYCEPKPDPVPPIIVGGGGPTTLMLAAQYADWWNHYDANWARYSAGLDALRDYCAKIDRDYKTLRLTWFGHMVLGATEEEAIAMGNGKWTINNSFTGTPTQVIEQIKPFLSAGVDYFMVDILNYDNPAILDRVAEVKEILKNWSQ